MKTTIGIIGTGNVAWHFAKLFSGAGMSVSGVLVRKKSKAESKALNELFSVPLEDDLQRLMDHSDILLIAVNDESIPEIASHTTAFKGIVCHTSGSVPLSAVARCCSRSGVLYPLQTLTKGNPVPPERIPLCIEGSQPSVEQVLTDIAETTGCPSYHVSSDDRLLLHIAAVLACNFTHHILVRAKELLDTSGIDFDLLKPLVLETSRKATSSENLTELQTGPARRRDADTIARHLNILSEYPETRELYRLLSDSIMKYYQ